MSTKILDTIGAIGAVPVVTGDKADDAEHLGAALIDGGLPFENIATLCKEAVKIASTARGGRSG